MKRLAVYCKEMNVVLGPKIPKFNIFGFSKE